MAVANKNLAIMGHSHMATLARAYRHFYRDGAEQSPFACHFIQMRNAEFSPNIVTGESAPKLNGAIAHRLKLIDQYHHPDVFVSCIMGNEHNFLAMLNHRRRFDFYLPSRLDLPTDEKAEILPVGLVEDLIRSRLATMGFLLAALAPLCSGRLVHVPPPPPVRQAAHIESYPRVFAKHLEKLGVSPAFFRLKMWILTCEVQQKLCEGAGVGFHRLPEIVFDPEGFLAEPFLNDDPSHGNAQYGKVLLDDIAATNSQRSVTEKKSERSPVQELAGLSSLETGS